MKESPKLTSPVRPNYVTGVLLSADDLDEEQRYHREMHRLHGRSLHGEGTVWGLEVRGSEESSEIVIEPGLAIDAFGREIIVPRSHELADPRQPTNDAGEPCDDRVEHEVITLCLQYAEFKAGEISAKGGDRHTRIREGYVLRPLPGEVKESAPRITAQDCEALVAAPKAERTRLLRGMLERTTNVVDDPCVPLAVLRWPGAGSVPTITRTAVVLPSLRGVFDLLLCLLEMVETTAGNPAD